MNEFLASHSDFRLLPVAEVLRRQGVDIAGTGEYLKLQPHVHDTDGFFAAVMEKNKAPSK